MPLGRDVVTGDADKNSLVDLSGWNMLEYFTYPCLEICQWLPMDLIHVCAIQHHWITIRLGSILLTNYLTSPGASLQVTTRRGPTDFLGSLLDWIVGHPGCHKPTMTGDGWNPTQEMVMLGMVNMSFPLTHESLWSINTFPGLFWNVVDLLILPMNRGVHRIHCLLFCNGMILFQEYFVCVISWYGTNRHNTVISDPIAFL